MSLEFSNMLELVILPFILFLCMMAYLGVAKRFSLVDIPNFRSSHTQVTVRGGGIIFLIAVGYWWLTFSGEYTWFVYAVFLLGIVSFVDDLFGLSPLVRFCFQFISFGLIVLQLEMLFFPWWNIAVIALLFVAAINAFNFMDGINGITGLYSIVSLSCFLLINERVVYFIDETLLLVILSSVLVFLFFNFRRRAVCFAGDVGSVTLAFVQIFVLLKLILTTNELGWILMLSVFGIDAAMTILFRLKKRQNILTPHRLHLYQLIANERGISHLIVSLTYAIIQFLINILVITFLIDFSVLIEGLFLVVLTGIYLVVRQYVAGRIKIESFRH